MTPPLRVRLILGLMFTFTLSCAALPALMPHAHAAASAAQSPSDPQPSQAGAPDQVPHGGRIAGGDGDDDREDWQKGDIWREESLQITGCCLFLAAAGIAAAARRARQKELSR